MSEPMQLHVRSALLRPNWRLKAAREQRGWSQQELADRLKITPNSVSRWERGISSPGIYYRRQLCDLLEMSAEELGLGSDTSGSGHPYSPQAPEPARSLTPRLWNIPFPRNPFFTGREAELRQLHQRLQRARSQGAPAVQALCGLAGIGKTQTAVEYAYRFAEHYQAALWVRAETQETLLSDFLALAALLELPERHERDPQRAVEAVKLWLRAQQDWLLILDNLEDLTWLAQFTPSIHQGHIVLTLRRQATGTLAQQLDLGKMDAQEGALFLLHRSRYLPLETEASEAAPASYTRAEEIAQILDGLPLALDQAGAYIEETGCSLDDYIVRYQSQRATLLTLRGSFTSAHPASVATMLSLIVERVEGQDTTAGELLQLCAFLYPDVIPEALLADGAPTLGPRLEPLAHDAYALDAAIKTLRDYSLIQRQAESKTLSLHRLVQAVLQDRLDEARRREWAQRAVALVSRAFPDSSAGEDKNWHRRQQYLPQAQACAALVEQWGIATHEAGLLLMRLGGCYLQDHCQYAQAEDALLRACEILRHAVGEMHADYALCLNDLGLTCMAQGDYTRAQACYQQALSIREQVCGNDTAALLESLNNMAGLDYEMGRYAQSEALLRRVLEIKESLSGLEDPDLAYYLSNLAFVCAERGKYAQAEPLLLRVIALRERLLGPEHPRTLVSLTILANLYAVRGQYEQAEALHLKILTLREKQLDVDNLDLWYSFYYLARVYHEQGKYAHAEAHYQRALTIFERALNPEHRRIAQTLNGLAALLLMQGQVERGEELCQRALSIRERTLGRAHPDYADSLATLALVAELRGDAGRATQLYRQALGICEGVLEPEHPLVRRCQAACERLHSQEASQPQTATPPSISPPTPEATLPQIATTEQQANTEQPPLADFLAACCECHPRARCRASDLWNAYQRWAAQEGERYPLSRRAFTEALKQQGFRPDRTNQYRTWRGIALRARSSESVTHGDAW